MSSPGAFPSSPAGVARIAAVAIAALLLPSASLAGTLSIDVTASYEEMRGGSWTADSFIIANRGEGSIVELQLDLSDSYGAVFDPDGAPFLVTSGDDVGFDTGVGFDLIADDLLRLVFSGFDPSESFAFGVDIDDRRSYTTGDDFAGSVLSVVMAGSHGPLQGVFAEDPDDSDRAIVSIQETIATPEPSTFGMLVLGFAALAARNGARRKAGQISR